MSSIKEKLATAVKDAMRAKEKDRLAVLRLMQAALKQKEVDERKDLVDEDVLGIFRKMLKQRNDSITQYKKASREDLVAQEEAEIVIIEEFLPAQLPVAEIEKIIVASCEQAQASSMKDMGKVMAILKPKLQSSADMSVVSKILKEKLNS